ncbi:MAG: hypothetical protein JST34_03410 [Bacteroidetes bacterium]|nr:hypothetical protein [Bacteroidota bacterium]
MTPSSINYGWTILFSVLTIVSCGQTTTNNQTDTTKVTMTPVQPVDTSLIAIIPFDKSRDWLFDKTYSPSTLTKSDIEKIERLMTDCIDKYNNKLSSDNKQYFSIDLTKEKYKRQYVAVINKNGDKEVWINCLCQTHGNDWKTSIIMVDDGGNCYFNLKINLTKDKCYDLGVNGHA